MAIWTKCKYGGGPGYVGIDEAITQYTAHAYCRLSKPTPAKLDAIVEDTLRHIRAIWSRDAQNEEWDWRAEAREVRQKLNRWIKRWENIRDNEREQRRGHNGNRKR